MPLSYGLLFAGWWRGFQARTCDAIPAFFLPECLSQTAVGGGKAMPGKRIHSSRDELGAGA